MRTFVKVFSFFVLFLVTVDVPVLWAAWIEDGSPICMAKGDQLGAGGISDGVGGAIITWSDGRSGNYDIYAQRVDASGAVLWTADGVAICAATGDQYVTGILSDGVGGAIITWQDYRSGNTDVYAQRVNASGNVQWTADGVAISTATENQFSPALISDGAGGAIITWEDYRSGTNDDIYAQRVDASGVVQWTADGVAIYTGTGNQSSPRLISDGVGGAIITWEDYRSGTNDDIYAQRVNASGAVHWTADGVAICTATGGQQGQQYSKLISDGAGGAIITWEDYRSGNYDIYAQRVDASGAVLWTADGVAICTAARTQSGSQLTSDGAGGAIITWSDGRSGTNYDIYAQRANASGAIQWTADGVAICTAYGDQLGAGGISDGVGGAIITWDDYRSGNYDIYAQRVPAGITDVPLTSKAPTGLSQNVPNPFNPLTRVTFSMAVPGEVSLRIYDIAGRMLRTLAEGWREPGMYSEVWDGRGDDGIVLPSGVYFYSLKAGGVVATKKMVLLK